MLNGVVTQKLQLLDEILNELRSLGQVDAQQLQADWRTRRAVERDLQVLVEVVIDVCQRLISLQGQTPASTSISAIERCIQLGALTDDEIYRQMVRFRNFIVHRYERVDPNILVEMINEHLVDFEQFRDEILSYVKDH
ncbi:MAG: DUF86 domain-containing protein [Anaerolineales bacterium]|nr:DUF86 domain-containing protein [Anaerolineales bacterium]